MNTKSLLVTFVSVLTAFTFPSARAHDNRQDSLCERILAKAHIHDVDGYLRVAPNLEMYYRYQTQGPTPGLEPDRPTILVIHGAASNSQPYDSLAAYLDLTGYDVLRVDLPGHGRTLLRSGVVPATFAQQGEYITKIMEALGIARAAIYGHSMGAGPALMTAIEFKKAGGLVRGLFLDDPYVFPLDDYYAANPDELTSVQSSRAFKKLGRLQMKAGAALMLTPWAFTGIPQLALVAGATNAGFGQLGEHLTAAMAKVSVPFIKENMRALVAQKIANNPRAYQIDGGLPANPDLMAAGALAAFDQIDLRRIAPRLEGTRAVIMLGRENVLNPRNLMHEFANSFRNGTLQHLDGVGHATPHFHPMEAAEAVARAIGRRDSQR